MDALIAEDYDPLAKALYWALSRMLPGWDIQRVSDGRTAGYILIMDPGLKLAVVDYFLPHADGEKIITEALKVRPHLRGRIIVCSGISEFPEDVHRTLFEDLGCHRLDKPIDFDEMERLVHKIVGMP